MTAAPVIPAKDFGHQGSASSPQAPAPSGAGVRAARETHSTIHRGHHGVAWTRGIPHAGLWKEGGGNALHGDFDQGPRRLARPYRLALCVLLFAQVAPFRLAAPRGGATCCDQPRGFASMTRTNRPFEGPEAGGFGAISLVMVLLHDRVPPWAGRPTPQGACAPH
jgi:hypothetical protein